MPFRTGTAPPDELELLEEDELLEEELLLDDEPPELDEELLEEELELLLEEELELLLDDELELPQAEATSVAPFLPTPAMLTNLSFTH